MEAHLEGLPFNLRPMLATGGELPLGSDWIFELKWDGVRALVAHDATDGGGLRIWTRNGNVVTSTYPELTQLAEVVADHNLVLDGEIVAFGDDGKPSFNKLQGRLGIKPADAILRSRGNPVVFVVFDLVHLDQMTTRSLPWSHRRSLLERLIPDKGPAWALSTTHTDGVALSEATRAADLEGVVAKRISSPYSPGTRSPHWVKVKNNTIEEFVIGGWVPGEGRRESMIGALLLGQFENDEPDAKLMWVGKAGTGFTMAELERLHALLLPLRDRSHFANDPGEPNAIFVRPHFRCNVEFREWTKDGIIRFPSYKGLTNPNDDPGSARPNLRLV